MQNNACGVNVIDLKRDKVVIAALAGSARCISGRRRASHQMSQEMCSSSRRALGVYYAGGSFLIPLLMSGSLPPPTAAAAHQTLSHLRTRMKKISLVNESRRRHANCPCEKADERRWIFLGHRKSASALQFWGHDTNLSTLRQHCDQNLGSKKWKWNLILRLIYINKDSSNQSFWSKI